MNGNPGTHVVEAAWLEAAINDPELDIRIVDMRGSVKTNTDERGEQTAEYTGALADYLASHIPGAIYFDWTSDLIDESNPVPVQAANSEKLERVIGGAGIGDETLIVAYDSHPSLQFSTRLWWLMRYYGNKNVRVLNGGWPGWIAENRPQSSVVPAYEGRQFTARPDPDWIANAADVLLRIEQGGTTVIDARDEGQYTGAIRRGKRGGHIPGAINLPRERIFEAPGMFKSKQELERAITEAGVSVDRDNKYLAYCNGGVAATAVLFALSMLGCEALTNYDGSWNEWNLNEDLPVSI